MAYIVVLNPIILAYGKDVDGQVIGDGTTPQVALVAAGTAFVAGVLTIIMGVVGRVPFAMAAGLGLNAFVTFNIASVMTWEEAMGLVFLEGVIIAILVLTGLRTAVFHAIPAQLKTAISVGIGLFIALIGFVDAGFVRKAAGTPLELGIGGQLTSWPVFVFIVGLLATAAMVARK
ncbi:MAG: NCS2 family permease, partial [Nonomuraea sp.]|nr:NCS2 family permease [Nonomuraea sp.]